MGWVIASILLLIMNVDAGNMFWAGVWATIAVLLSVVTIRDQF